MGWDPATVPDPQDPATYERSRLDWSEREEGAHARLLARYRQLIALRRSLPELTDPSFGSTACRVEGRLFTMRRGSLLVAVNTGDTPVDVPGPAELLFATGDGVTLTGTGLHLPPHAGALAR
jgi:maltooligosyltrehalose trehalohydrolase